MAIDPLQTELNGAHEGCCFFCAEQFTPDELTREHVFPLWLLQAHNLLDRRLTLLNSTTIPYRQLTVPACHPCNTVYLSQIENQLSKSIPGGALRVRSMGHAKLFVWLAKIFFGILYAEALLPLDRSGVQPGSIVSQELLNEFKQLHRLMTIGRSTHTFVGEVDYHSSILVFPMQEHPVPEHRFDYCDDLEFGCLAIRFCNVGLVYIGDGGAQERFANEVMPKLFNHPLHPLQFAEIAAKVFTKRRSFTRNPSLITIASADGTRLIQPPIGGMSDKPIFGEFDLKTYAGLLSKFTRSPFERCYDEGGRMVTFIGDLNAPRTIDVNTNPWP